MDRSGNTSAASNAATVTVVEDPNLSAMESVPSGTARTVPPRSAMEAATPLRQPRVHVLLGRVIVDNVVIDDPATAAYVARRMEAGDNAACAVVADAVEVGARVLEREQTAMDTEYVRNEFEKVSREVETAFTDRHASSRSSSARRSTRSSAPQDGLLARELQRLFGDGSSVAVQPSCARSCTTPRRRCGRTCCGSSPRPTARPPWRTSRPPTCARLGTRPRVRRPRWRRCVSRWSR